MGNVEIYIMGIASNIPTLNFDEKYGKHKNNFFVSDDLFERLYLIGLIHYIYFKIL